MTPLHSYGTDATHRTGQNPQAQEWLRRMLKQGLIRRVDGEFYEITEAGKILAKQFREQGEM